MSDSEEELDEMAEAAAQAILTLSENMPEGCSFALIVRDQAGHLIICGIGDDKVSILRDALRKIDSGELVEADPDTGDAVSEPN